MPVPQPGATIPIGPKERGETFAIGRILGTGGMGTVVEATHAPSGRRVALKFLHDELLTHPTIPKRFQREVELATSLSTAHVARTFGVERTNDGTPFMIMEFLSGRDLCGVLRADGRLGHVRACRIISQACEALEEAHARGIVHRDLKPENLFISQAADGTDWVKVLDFGISKVVNDGIVAGQAAPGPKLTRVGTTVGTPEYMAPEQLRGAGDLDASADVYSLGCVLYEILAGRRPHVAPVYEDLVRKICNESPTPLAQLRGDLPPGLADVIARAMARDRRQRIPTARALREALTSFAAGRRAEGTVVMEPPPPSGPVLASVPPNPASSSGPIAAKVGGPPPIQLPPTPTSVDRTVTRGGDTIVDEHHGGGGMGIGLILTLIIVALLLGAGVVLLVFPHWVGLR